MKSRTQQALAIAVAALVAPAAWAQFDQHAYPAGTEAPPGMTLTDSNYPTTTPDETAEAARAAGHNPHDVPRMTYVSEPTASASKTDGADGVLGNALVEALNADSSLKGCKLTVEPEDGKVTITGVTMTEAQKKRAVGIAEAKVGAGNVIDAIRNSDV
jgi:hypothetical protein